MRYSNKLQLFARIGGKVKATEFVNAELVVDSANDPLPENHSQLMKLQMTMSIKSRGTVVYVTERIL